MQDMMRKHKRFLTVFIFLTIGIPMLFFGIPAFWEEPDQRSQGAQIGQVGDVPLEADAYMRNLQFAAQQQTQMGQPAPTLQEMDANGMSGRVLQDMIASAMIQNEAEKRNFAVSQAVEDRVLRQMQMFKYDNGKFDREAYEEWIQSNNDRGVNWNEIRDSIEAEMAQRVYQEVILAPAARVLDKEIDEQIQDASTKIQMKYVKVTPPVDVTDEELQKHYDANLESYRAPAKQVAEFVRIPLTPEMPANAAEIVQRAQGGEDFAVLADETTSLELKDGGDLGWMVQGENEPAHRLPLYSLAVGAVSEPIAGPGGYFIYKVEEERTNPETQVREVHARQIFLRADLTPEQRDAKQAQADAIAAKAKESGDLAAAAQEQGLTVERTGQFDSSGAAVENVPQQDARMFSSTLANPAEGETISVVTGTQNLYVARIAETVEGAIPPLAEVRERVREDVVAQKKQEPAYAQKVQEYTDKITAQAKTLADIATQFPELGVEVKETKPFGVRDYLFQEQIYLQTPEVYAALKGKEAGAMAGPFKDFQGETYFVELTNRIEATEEEKAKWPEERKTLRQQAVQMAERQLFEDYKQDLQDRRLIDVGITLDQDAIGRIHGRGETAAGDEAATATDGTAAPAGGAPAPAIPAAGTNPPHGQPGHVHETNAPHGQPGHVHSTAEPAATAVEAPVHDDDAEGEAEVHEEPAAAPAPAPAAAETTAPLGQ